MIEFRTQTMNGGDVQRFDVNGNFFRLLSQTMGQAFIPQKPRVVLRRHNKIVADTYLAPGMTLRIDAGFDNVEIIAVQATCVYWYAIGAQGEDIDMPRPEAWFNSFVDDFSNAYVGDVAFTAGQTKNLLPSGSAAATELLITPTSTLKISGQTQAPSVTGFTIAGGTTLRLTGPGAQINWQAYSAGIQTVNVMRIATAVPAKN